MTIIEAIKSGRRFKRQIMYENKYWLRVVDGHPLPKIHNGSPYALDIEDIIADDWEIEEERIELTKDQIRKALLKYGYTSPLEQCFRELGFK